MIDCSSFRCPRKSKEQIRKTSADVKATYWKDRPLPIDMELLISKGLGLDVIPESYIEKLVKTDAYLTRDLSAIIVDLHQYMDEGDRWANRLRFAMAHEVGHYILHKNVYTNLEITSDEDYIDFVQNAPEDEYKAYEWQANEFAGSLLVPREMLELEIRKLVKKITDEGIVHMLPEYANDILARNLEFLARPFGVSTWAMEIRVYNENLWPPPENMLY